MKPTFSAPHASLPTAGRGGALSGGLDAWAAGGGRADQGESPATEGQLRKLEQLGYEG